MGADSWHCSAVCRYVSRLGRVQPWVDCTALKQSETGLSLSLSLFATRPPETRSSFLNSVCRHNPSTRERWQTERRETRTECGKFPAKLIARAAIAIKEKATSKQENKIKESVWEERNYRCSPAKVSDLHSHEFSIFFSPF